MKPLSIAFDLPFDEAIAAAKARKVMLPEAFYAPLKIEKRQQAQTVSYLASLDQIQAVIDRLNQHVADGGTLKEFQAWAKTQDFGLKPAHLETIFRNGVQTAYNAGHWRSFEETAEDRPYLMYDAINDSRTRPAHRKLDGIIRKIDDPFWNTHSPCMGHRCRCRLLSLNESQALARSRDGNGLNKVETPDMKADNEGWGRKPTAWSQTLEEVKKAKEAKLAPSVAVVDNAGMGKINNNIISNLIERAKGADDFSRFSSLWVSDRFRERHIAKRIAEGAITNEQEYARLTFDVLANASKMVVAEPVSSGMRITGKIQVEVGGWIVLLSEEGHVITSYPFVGSAKAFEARHIEMGDHVYEQEITSDDRAVLAQLFGTR